MSRSRPVLFTFTRHSMESGFLVPKLKPTCQPSLPGASAEGNRIGNVPKPPGLIQVPYPTSAS